MMVRLLHSRDDAPLHPVYRSSSFMDARTRIPTRIPAATLGVALMALVTATSPLAAQKTGIGFGASIGANLPNGEFADGAKTGLVANGFVGVGAGRFGLRGELFWSRSDLDNPFIRKVGNDVLPETGSNTVTGDVNLIGGVANLVLPL